MFDKVPLAFISCRFAPDEVVEAICNLLKPEINCKISTDLFLRPIPPEILRKIKESDLLVAIITLDKGDSPWIQNELGMAYALEKPILVFYEDGIDPAGFAPMVSEYIQFKRNDLGKLIRDKDRLIKGITGEVNERWQKMAELMTLEEQKRLGMVGIYPDRKDAFSDFSSFWDSEKDEICIVSSTLEGFRKFVGDAGSELLESKIRNGCNIKILLTHKDYLGFRAKNENISESSIQSQLDETLKQINPLLSNKLKNTGTIEVRWFENPPTCFAIMTKSHMLLNPYPYMRTAYSSFAVIVCKTERHDDIFRIYFEYHFKRAWENSNPIDFNNIN